MSAQGVFHQVMDFEIEIYYVNLQSVLYQIKISESRDYNVTPSLMHNNEQNIGLKLQKLQTSRIQAITIKLEEKFVN
mgnify:CR=1 FL=1